MRRDINGVPFPMIMATHFYFTFYHTLSNMALRKVRTSFGAGACRTLFECVLVFTMSYLTAFMEALTISGFPCYSFDDRRMAW
jgi:cycloeucalenol cycloisomerase